MLKRLTKIRDLVWLRYNKFVSPNFICFFFVPLFVLNSVGPSCLINCIHENDE